MNFTNKAVQESLWTSPIAKTLENVYLCKCPATLFVTRAREVFREVKPNGPPFDPYQYADALGISIKEQDIPLDGIVKYDSTRKFEITLNRNCSLHRKNFTLAHEIAHTFFYLDLHEFGEPSNRDGYDPEEERLCDLAAAELLMPFSVFKGDLVRLSEDGVITPEAVFSLMDRYQVSLQAVARRISWIRKDSGCALWKKEGTYLRPEWVTPAKLKRLSLCRTGHSSIEQALRSPRQAVTGMDTYYIDGKRSVHKTVSRAFRSGLVFSIMQPRNYWHGSAAGDANAYVSHFKNGGKDRSRGEETTQSNPIQYQLGF